MKSLLFVPAACLGLTSLASAADLGGRYPSAAPYAVPPALTWTGFYAGFNAGYGFGEVDGDLRREGGLVAGFSAAGIIPNRLTIDRDGVVLGGQIGYNMQFGMFVAGIEADIAYSGVSGSATRTFTDPRGPGFRSNDTRLKSELGYLGTVRGRFGAAFDRVMVYATGGLAYGETTMKGSITSTDTPEAFPPLEGRSSDTKVGFTVGAGAEVAVINNVTIRGEYLYYNLGSETVAVSRPRAPGHFADYRIEDDGHLTRLGVNYKF